MKNLKIAGIALVVVALFMAIFHPGGSGRTSDNSSATARYVNVQGVGTVKVVPDSVLLSTSVTAKAATSAGALAAASKSANNLRGTLTQQGIVAKYLKTSQLTVGAEYSYTDNVSKVVGYRATQSFTVTIRNAATAGPIVDAISNAVGNNLSIDSVTPFVYDLTAAESAARSDAMAQAKSKAEAYAKLAGVKLGQVLNISENLTQNSPVPANVMAKGVAADSATSIDPGTQAVSITVNVNWGIK